MVEVLSATSKGPNTFWSKTKFPSLSRAEEQYPENTYREKDGKIQWLVGKKEGPNTFWKFFDYGTIAEMKPPVDKRLVVRDCERTGDPEHGS